MKSLQARDRIIPVVGNLSGPTALAAIGHVLAEKGETLSAFYASNVEFYLDRTGLVTSGLSAIWDGCPIRAVVSSSARVFNRGFGGSTSAVQPVEEVLAQFPVGR